MALERDYRLLTLSDVEPAARVMAEAFQDDPLCGFMLPVERTRAKTMYKFFCAMGEVSIQQQRVYGVGEPLKGVAYWKAPNQENMSIRVSSLGKFLPLLFTYYPIGFFRSHAIFRQIDAMHARYASEPHYYLDNIGVLASARGKGFSSRLIRPIIEKAEAQGVIAYTETATRANVSLYEHFGFECVEECAIPGTGVTICALRRGVKRDV
jgi:ribosomal protein S18 acetylase RimI-like enzyme